MTCNFLVCMILWLYRSVKVATYFHTLNQLYCIPVPLLRKYEKLMEKQFKLNLDRTFFEKCQVLRVVPKFLKMRVPKVKALVDANAKEACNTIVLNSQIKHVDKLVKCNKRQLSAVSEQLRASIPWIRLIVLKLIVLKSVKNKMRMIADRQSDKLKRLWLLNRSEVPEAVVNLSSYKLSMEEEELLRYGLKHSIIPKKLNNDRMKYEVEKTIASNVRNNTDFRVTPIMKQDIQTVMNNFFKEGKKVCNEDKNKRVHDVLRKLANRKDIRICAFDKGNGLVLINTDEYKSKMYEILNDKDKFEQVEVDSEICKHPTVTEENRVYRFLYKYVKKYVDEKTYKYIIPSGSEPGKMYGSVKVHKSNKPMRPIISTIGTATYNLAKYLDNIIKRHIDTKYMLRSTQHLIEKINEHSSTFNDKHILVSFDVVSLFTNIPVDETIQLAANLVYTNESSYKPRYGKDVFIKLCKFATSGNFLFDDRMFRQTDGVSMGSPLAPTLANLFLSELERNWFKESCSPVLYYRYVDDCICLFDNLDKVSRFQEFLNHQHPNLKFTSEIGGRNISFLDVNINIKDDVETSVFTKDTSTGLLLNFNADCPKQWHTGLVLGMLNRAFRIASNWNIFDNEVNKILQLFKSNAYPEKFILNLVKRILFYFYLLLLLSAISPAC